MADFLSLHWGERILGVEASVSGGSIRIRQTMSVDRPQAADGLDAGDSSESQTSGEKASRWLADAVQAAGISTKQTTVMLGQKDVVTRWLELPAVPDEELPDMVKWQAGTKSTLPVDQLLVDYLPLPASEESDTRAVLLATVARATVTEIRRELSAAGLELHSVGVGSLALADLAGRATAGPGQRDGLVIAADRKQLEVIVQQKGFPVLTHSALLAADGDTTKAAGQAISRALFAAGNTVSQLDLSTAVLMGGLAGDLKETVTARLARGDGEPDVRVASLADISLVQFRGGQDEELVGSPAFVAAVGGLLSASGQLPDHVDFLDPHKPPPPERKVSNQNMVRIAVGVLLAVGLVYGLQTISSRSLKDEIKNLKTQISLERIRFRGGDAAAKTAKLPSTSAIDQWQQKRVNWLDQLHELSPLIGDSNDVILTEVNMSQDVRRGLGRITVTGLANDRVPVSQMTNQIRGHKNYDVRPSKLDPNKDRQATYKYRFSKLNIELDGKAETPGDKVVEAAKGKKGSGDVGQTAGEDASTADKTAQGEAGS